MSVPLLTPLRYRTQRVWARIHTRWLANVIFVHINKTGGSSIEAALGLPFQHRTARELLAELGPRRWSERFSFAFVRNPWDKVASHYHFRVKTNQTALRTNGISFNDWVREAYGEHNPRYYDQPKMFMPQVEWLTDDAGRILVDFVGRFERLEEDFLEVCRRIGRERVTLPHRKAASRLPYRELYEPDTVEIVGRRFEDDIRRFGYCF